MVLKGPSPDEGSSPICIFSPHISPCSVVAGVAGDATFSFFNVSDEEGISLQGVTIHDRNGKSFIPTSSSRI
jgi:hypothetical protein